MEEFFEKLFSPSGFPARWYCGDWSDFHGWLYISSSLLTFLAYLFIPLVLFYVTSRKPNAPFRRIFYLFIAFIWLCSLTHLTDAIIFWYPVYRLNAVFLFLTGLVSVATLLTLIRRLPSLIALRSPRELEAIIEEQTRELKSANARLADQEKRFRELANQNPDIIVALDESLKHTFLNETVMKYRPEKKMEELLGAHISELDFPLEVLKTHLEQLNKALNTDQKQDYQVSYERNGKMFYFAISLVPFGRMSETGKREILCVSRDISALKQQEARLEEQNKALRLKNDQLQDFNYIVSHNLKSPIYNLQGLNKLQHQSTDLEEKQVFVAKSAEVLNGLEQTVNELDELLQLEREEEIPVTNCRFESTIEQVKQSLSSQIHEHNVKIETHLEVEQIAYPKVYLDSIFLNLISNAIKYRHRNRESHIRIRVFKDEKGKLIATFQDNGVGMDMEAVGDKLFRLRKTFHGNEDARGVGLYMTRRQIESQGGTISVSSEPDKGTTFRVTF